MVRAILDRRKTQTRRMANVYWDTSKHWGNYDCWTFRKGNRPLIGFSTSNGGQHTLIGHCPFGTFGDRLWVRETFYNDIPGERDLENVYYRADGDCCQQIPECQCASVGPTPWKPSIHMPRWASRITLEITNVRVERLRDISEEDAKAEGVSLVVKSHRTGFVCLWDSVYHNWQSNPWVWAITFKKL